MSDLFSDRFRSQTRAPGAGEPELQLWAAVLTTQIEDAVRGAVSIHGNAAKRARITADARAYFRKPSPSLAVICELLGLDPVAVRDHVMQQIRAAEREVAPGGGSRLPEHHWDRRGEHRTRDHENKFSGSRHAVH